jgi:superfamily II DNA or RNA helicase
MPLRDYQAEAISSAYQYLRDNPGKNPCIVLPTGAGKTAVIATICRDAVENWGGRVLVVSHVKELVEQSAATLRSWYPSLDVGVYSAGVGRRDIDNDVIVAGIQSIHDKGLKLCGSRPFNLVLVDEAHRIPPGGDGQYQTLLIALQVANPKVRVIGLTATPYRTKGGWVCSDDHFLNEICYEVSVRQLIAQGYLSKLTSKHSQNDADLSGVSIQRGEFASGEMEEAFDAIVESAVDEIIHYGRDRKSVLVFCAGVEHAVKVAERLAAGGESVERLTGSTNKFDREKIVDDFKAGRTKYLCNVNVLTEGFDATGVDMVVLLRATLSPGLYCLDEYTEILTPQGWSSFIESGEDVYGFNKDTGEIVICKCESSIRRELLDGEFFCEYENPNTSFRVTNRHRMLITGRRSKEGWKFCNAEDVAKYNDSVQVPKAGLARFPGVPLSPDELRFIGWVMTDGNINKANNAITIVQSEKHSSYCEEIERVIQSCGMKFGRVAFKHESQFFTGTKTRGWTISKGKPRGRDKELRGWGYLSEWISKDFSPSLMQMTRDQFAILLEAIHLGDGAKQANQNWTRRSYHISTANKVFAERLQICAVLRGYRCTMSLSKNTNGNDIVVLHIKDTDRSAIGGHGDRPKVGISQGLPKEQVWCIQNETGTIITRRNGKVMIMGNCQMVGRGLRLHEGKENCLVLDFGGNVKRHGPIDDIRVKSPSADGPGLPPAKECPECKEVVPISYSACPDCGYVFPEPEPTPRHEPRAGSDAILTTERVTIVAQVSEVHYSVHFKKGWQEGQPRTMRVDYYDGITKVGSEWVCIEHKGYAWQKAYHWWTSRSNARLPLTVDDAVAIANLDLIAKPNAIKVKTGGQFDEVVDYDYEGVELEEVDQDWLDNHLARVTEDDEVPF